MNGFEYERFIKDYLYKEYDIKSQRTSKSGATFADEDLISENYLIQVKYTSKDYFTVTTKILERLKNNAEKSLRTALLIFGDIPFINIYKVIREVNSQKNKSQRVYLCKEPNVIILNGFLLTKFKR